MSDVEKIIAEDFAGVLVVRREMSEAQRNEIARVALSALRAAGYEVEKPEYEYQIGYPGEQNYEGFDPYTTYEAAVSDLRRENEPDWVVVRRRKAGAWEPVEGEK